MGKMVVLPFHLQLVESRKRVFPVMDLRAPLFNPVQTNS